MQGLLKPGISFLVQSRQELQKKNHPKNIYLRATTPRSNPLSMYLQISQTLDQTPSSVTYPHVTEGSKGLKIWLPLLGRQNNMDFMYLQGTHFPQTYYHNRLQGRPH